MRDPLVTRRLLAKIDRELDVYVVLDRFRQAIYDMDDEIAKLEKHIRILEAAERERVTETGVQKIIGNELNKTNLTKTTKILGAIGALVLAAASAAIGRYFRGN